MNPSATDTDDHLYTPGLSTNGPQKVAEIETSVRGHSSAKPLTSETSSSEDGTTTLAFVDVPETEMVQSSSKRGMMDACHMLCQKSPLTFTLASSLCLLTQINMFVFTVSQITFLEKEFGFSSSQTGQILSASEIGYLSLVLPSGYLASRLHVPRVMSLTALIFGVVSILCGLPHFLFSDSSSDGHRNSSFFSAADILPALCREGPMEEEEKAERCRMVTSLQNGTSSPGEVVYSEHAYTVFVFLTVCQVIRGAMATTTIPMFVEYLETNAKKTDTGFYMGIHSSLSMVGPAVAFIGGGAISRLHVSLQPTELTPTHPNWVGAWWLGFLIFGSLAAVAPVFLCHFPRQLGPPSPPSPPPPLPLSSTSSFSSVGSHQKNTTPRVHHEKETRLAFFKEGVAELKGFLLSVVELLTNRVYVFLVVSGGLMGFSMNGSYLFLPKYLQDQFQLPAWKANFIMGGVDLTLGSSGLLVSGWLTKRLELTRSSVYKLLMAVTLTAALLVAACMFVGCPQTALIGDPSSMDKWDSNCVVSCACPAEVFPVCDEETGETYFSPCHAGCSDLQDGVYMNCSCTASGQVYPGDCTSECSSVYYYSVIFCIMIFFISMSPPLSYLVVVRSVSTPQTGLAVGLCGFVGGIVGFLIGPMVYGSLIDSFCDHWKRPCGVQGQCSVYDKDRFRVELHLYSAISMALGVVCFLFSFLFFTYCPQMAQSDTQEKDVDVISESGDKKAMNSPQTQEVEDDKAITREPHNLPLPKYPDTVMLMDGGDTPGAGDSSLIAEDDQEEDV